MTVKTSISIPMTPPKPLVVSYSTVALADEFGNNKIIETYMTSNGDYFYREHEYGFQPFNAWMEGQPAVRPTPSSFPTTNEEERHPT